MADGQRQQVYPSQISTGKDLGRGIRPGGTAWSGLRRCSSSVQPLAAAETGDLHIFFWQRSSTAAPFPQHLLWRSYSANFSLLRYKDRREDGNLQLQKNC